jgi:hypothetical protein
VNDWIQDEIEQEKDQLKLSKGLQIVREFGTPGIHPIDCVIGWSIPVMLTSKNTVEWRLVKEEFGTIALQFVPVQKNGCIVEPPNTVLQFDAPDLPDFADICTDISIRMRRYYSQLELLAELNRIEFEIQRCKARLQRLYKLLAEWVRLMRTRFATIRGVTKLGGSSRPLNIRTDWNSLSRAPSHPFRNPIGFCLEIGQLHLRWDGATGGN